MPTSLTRREFMKDLGLVGVGAGLAPAVAFGEAWDDKPGPPARPDWVKEVDKPTIEIDWDMLQRFDGTNAMSTGFIKVVGEERLNKLQQIRQENLHRWLEEGKPGYTLKDQALAAAVRSYDYSQPTFLGPQQAMTPEERGASRWEGTPEEAASMLTAALRFLGAASVGFVELEPHTTQKLIYAVDRDGSRYEFADVDQPYVEESSDGKETRVIPNKARWAIVYTIQMSQETWTRAPTPLGNMTATMGYDMKVGVQRRAQEFLRGLGYMGLGEQSFYNALGIKPGLGVMAGLGELSRLNRLVTPEYGPVVRVFMLITDLPLASGKPIDAGIMEFCRRCKKCADLCPAKALSFDDEPTWEVRGPWNNPGKKAYFEDSIKCYSYWQEVGTGCAICFAVCPFASDDKALIHAIRNRVAATTPIFDKTLKSLDDLLYTPVKDLGMPQKDPEQWWDLDLPEYGFDTTRAKRDT